MTVLALLLVVYAAFTAQYCPSYKCSSSTQTTVCNTMTEDAKGVPTFNIKKICDSGLKCDVSFIPDNDDTCVTETAYLYPGEKCKLNESDRCISKECDSCRLVCKGVLANGQCTTNDDCDVGLYCDSGSKCKPWKEIGEECGVGVECASHLVCNDKKCVLPGSISIGEVATNPLACSTLYIYETGMKSVCSSGPIRMSGVDCMDTCRYKLNVPGSTTINVSEPCKCGLTNNGSLYCPRGMGDYAKQLKHVSE